MENYNETVRLGPLVEGGAVLLLWVLALGFAVGWESTVNLSVFATTTRSRLGGAVGIAFITIEAFVAVTVAF